MDKIRKILETEANGLKIDLLEYDLKCEDSLDEIKGYLIDKIKTSKVHDLAKYNLNFYGSKNLIPEFKEKVNERIAQICTPQRAQLPQFDVRRERVTEWLAQFVLERKYGCKFYNESDKRINLKPFELNKHTPGIDVPGILMDGDNIRFVICEVKASEEAQIPCKSASELQKDIQKSIDNVDNRVSLEILGYMQGINDIEMSEDILSILIEFLVGMIANEHKNIVDKLYFYPFLIRNNKKIVSERNAEDYKNFSLNGVDKENVQNIILAFEEKFDQFSNAIYEEALGK